MVDFLGKKGDLSLVGIAVIEKPVAADAMSGHAFDRIHFHRRIIIGLLAMMPEIIVRGRNVELDNFHAQSYHAAAALRIRVIAL